MNTRSIRFRLTIWYALVLSAGLSLFGILVWVSLQHQLLAELDAELEGRASRLEAYFKEESAKTSAAHLEDELEEFSQAFAPTSHVEIRGARGFAFRYPPRSASQTPEGRALRRHFSLDGQDFSLEVEVPTNEMDRTMALLRRLLLWLIPVVIAIACLGGALLSGRALRPVVALTQAARSISIENLSERLPVADTGDELAQLAATLNMMLARLEGAVTSLSQFVADASHEFRTPLAVIQTTVELALRRPRSTAEYRQSLEEIGDEVTRMTHLVEDLLALARSDTGAVEMPRASVDVRSVLDDVLSETRSLADFRKVRVTPPAGYDAAVISGNRAALHRLFLVLMDNALKYSRTGGEVVVTVQQQDSNVSVTIRDFGVGIPAAQIPHIFERFYRGDPARGAGGHGLGLALARSIVRSHGARIEVASTEGVSTEFRVEFTPRSVPLDSPASTRTSSV
jgi:two-component system heavy metal sensor histidine kinase CusS